MDHLLVSGFDIGRNATPRHRGNRIKAKGWGAGGQRVDFPIRDTHP
jgi:hypothetical protein